MERYREIWVTVDHAICDAIRMTLCLECGATVFDSSLHDKFHESLENFMKNANEAYYRSAGLTILR